MQPTELAERLRALARKNGPAAELTAMVSSRDGGATPGTVLIYPQGTAGRAPDFVSGSDWGEILAAVESRLTEYRDSHRATRVRELAQALIAAKYDTGSCSESGLRLLGFSSEEVREMGPEAEKMADEMADGAPFVIFLSESAGNGGEEHALEEDSL